MREIINSFFEKLWVSYDSFEVNNDEKWYTIKIQTQESGLLIWPSWKNLEAIQTILRQMVNNDETKIKLRIEVNDYLVSRDSRLLQFVQSKITEVKQTGIGCELPKYSPYERKKIHSFVAELNDEEIVVKSSWEWNERRMHISKKAKKLTIDIDWNDI